MLIFDAIKIKECSKCLEGNTKNPNIWCLKSLKMPLLTQILVVNTSIKLVFHSCGQQFRTIGIVTNSAKLELNV